MKPLSFLLSAIIILVSACEFKTEIKTAGLSSSNKIRNGIELAKNGLEVSQAFLMYEDGTLVPETNEAKVNQQVVLRLVIDKGFKEENGMVSVGISEKIETDKHEVLLDEKDLFSNTERISAKDAQYLSLKAVITKLDKLYDYFIVSFRVWDKLGNAEASGSYKLYIK